MSVNTSLSSLLHNCFESRTAVSIFNAFIITKILLCSPLSILVFHFGYQQWRQQQRSTKTASHADVMAYHMAAMELIYLVGCIFYFYGSYVKFPSMAELALCVSSMTIPAEMCFQSVTCVERYLAVVHPVIYLALRQSGGVRIRNISIGCVWLLCFGWVALKPFYTSSFLLIPYFIFLAFAIVVVSFCSLSVLCVLIRPGPGDGGRDKKQMDQSKQRAFHTVMAILAVLWLWLVGVFVCFSLELSPILSYSDGCMVMMSGIWFKMPSSVVLHLLFLHRAGKLQCCDRKE